MSQIVVDTDVASYIFNWHSLAQRYSDALAALNWFCLSCSETSIEPAEKGLRSLTRAVQ
jgi:hypothetical protein